MSDSSRAGLYYVEEAAWGVTPAAALSALRMTGESLKAAMDGVTSNEIRPDRQVTDWIKTAERAEGDVNFELSYGSFDKLLEGTLMSRWVTDGGGVGIDQLENGTTPISYTLERQYADVAEFMAYRGMRVSQLTLSTRPAAILTGTFGFMGRDELPAGATVGAGAPVAATTAPVMNTSDNLNTVTEGGLAFGDVMSIDLTINNTLRQQPAIGTPYGIGVGLGRCVVTGSVEAYFRTRTLYEKARNSTASSLSFKVTDSAGNSYTITVPRLKYTGREAPAGGNDQDITVKMPFQGIRDPATDASIILLRDPA